VRNVAYYEIFAAAYRVDGLVVVLLWQCNMCSSLSMMFFVFLAAVVAVSSDRSCREKSGLCTGGGMRVWTALRPGVLAYYNYRLPV